MTLIHDAPVETASTVRTLTMAAALTAALADVVRHISTG